MTLRIKFILVLLLFGFLILGTTLWSNHYTLHHTMVKYVDQRDQERLERLKNNVQVYLDQLGMEETQYVPKHAWYKLLALSQRIDLTQNFIPMDILMSFPFPKIVKWHPDDFESRVSLLDKDGNLIFGPEPTEYGLVACVTFDEEEVGHLGYNHRQELTEKADIEFAQNQARLLTWGAIAITLATLLLLWPVANHFLTPMRRLAGGMRRLSQGRFTTRLAHDRRDEFGQLQVDFNHLAASLEKNRESRNQWIADISHELRTPLTVLHGSIEAIRDGIRPASEKNLQQVHEEVLHLNRLVDDLYQVALNDVGGLNYKMEQIDFANVVAHGLAAVEESIEEKGLRLKYQPSDTTFLLTADNARLQQMVTNLLVNSVAYTDAEVVTEKGKQVGQIEVSLWKENGNVCFRVEDSAPSVDEEDISHLFERLYRAEASRNRRHGGAGLGLAIVHQIVEAHQGHITAEHSALGGINVTVCIPE